ncbi:MAG: lipocalin-like domain-containing protein [Chitinophagaceae bacterium]
MKRSVLLFLLLATSFISWSQSKKFVGVWSLVSVENVNADSSRTYPYGENPVGMLIFGKDGDYASQLLKAKRPKITSNNKNTATPEENKALVQGNNSHFGTYIIDEKDHTITYKVEYAFFPNWEGRELKASYILSGDTLRSFSTNTTFGGSSVIVTWRRRR